MSAAEGHNGFPPPLSLPLYVKVGLETPLSLRKTLVYEDGGRKQAKFF